MADIFISYSSEDRERIIPVVRALEACGWSVWWDRIIPPGKTFSRVIEEALGAARSLIVLWTQTSVNSDWVNNEAAEGARRQILIPALLDEVEIPFEFKRIQAANLIGWNGESEHAGFQQLRKALTDLLGPPAAPVPVPQPAEPTAARTMPGEMPADAARPPRPAAFEPSPEKAQRGRKSPAARIGAWIALAALISMGVILLLKTELIQSRRVSVEEPAPKPAFEAASPASRTEPPDTTRRDPTESKPAAPPLEAGALNATVKADPETVAHPSAETPKPGAPAHDTGPLKAATEPEPQKAVPPVEKGATPGAPEPGSRAAASPPKPDAQEPARSIAGEPKPDVYLPDSKAPAVQAKPEPQKPAPPARKPKPETRAPDPNAWASAAKPEEPPAALQPRHASPRKSIRNSVGMELVLIPAPAGPVAMGSRLSTEELIQRFGGTDGFYKSEKPFHPVKIERAFYLATTPVTQGQWRRVMGDNPSSFKACGEDCPVEMVSWEDAQRFIAKLNQMEAGVSYRLPSEAEWEYACRAGSDTEFFFGNDLARLGEFAWYSANSNNQTHPVGGKRPNAWGLYDMNGNAWQWVEDDWHATYDGAPSDGSAWIDPKRSASRVVRGGGWSVIARYCRPPARYYGNAGARTAHVGFRLVRSVAPGS